MVVVVGGGKRCSGEVSVGVVLVVDLRKARRLTWTNPVEHSQAEVVGVVVVVCDVAVAVSVGRRCSGEVSVGFVLGVDMSGRCSGRRWTL